LKLQRMESMGIDRILIENSMKAWFSFPHLFIIVSWR